MIDLENFDPTDANVALRAAERANRLEALLQESRREHHHCDDSWYCCPLCTSSDHGGVTPGGEVPKDVCNCSADAWNARVEAALNPRESAP